MVVARLLAEETRGSFVVGIGDGNVGDLSSVLAAVGGVPSRNAMVVGRYLERRKVSGVAVVRHSRIAVAAVGRPGKASVEVVADAVPTGSGFDSV